MIFQFGEFELDPQLGVLRGPGGEQPLRKQTCRLLEVLLKSAPDLQEHNTLLDLAWGHSALSPNVLPQAISELRHALGDQAQSPQYIQTLHRRGYRIICPVHCIPHPVLPSSEPTREALPLPPPEKRGNRGLLLGITASLTALAVVLGLWWQQTAQQRWIDQEVIPEIRELVGVDLAAGWRRLREVRAQVPMDPRLEQMWLDISLPNRLTSEPSGAQIAVRGFREQDADWIVLGQTPLEAVDLPLAMMRFRVSLPGYATIEAAPGILPIAETFALQPLDRVPDDMVYVPPGAVSYIGQQHALPGYWIDRHEVSNRDYLAFMQAGGYQQPDYWQHRADDKGVELTWAQMMARFVDTTGLAGPSTWALGTYPAGQDKHPVSGISWFEAAAFAAFRERQLPTVYHWRRAAGLGTPQMQNFSDVLLTSTFNASSTTPVGAVDSLGSYGTYDMSGNVAEWCYNADGPLRHIKGGFYEEDAYRFADLEARDPLERRAGFGLRLMLSEEPLEDTLTAAALAPERLVPAPVNDETFALYASLFDYDDQPLEVVIEEIDESHLDWRRERVSLRAAYGDERVLLQLFIPHNASPPYQTVVNFPGGDAILLDSSRRAGLQHVEPFLRSGRVVVYPVYQGTFERKMSNVSGPFGVRELLINQVKDLRRTIDYLATRDDIDRERLVFHGVSYGAVRAPLMLAMEPRFHNAIILSGGLGAWTQLPAEIQPHNYLPRVQLPVLMINGSQDYNFPVDLSQRPFFELLGTPPEHKQHLMLDWGHLPPHYTDVIKAYLDWMDRWLGPALPAQLTASGMAVAVDHVSD